MKQLRNVIWAVDVDADQSINDQAARALRPLLAATHATVEPVYVLSPISGTRPENLRLWKETGQKMAQELITGLSSRSELPGLVAPVVLSSPESSIRAATETLVQEATSKRADLVVVSTHARTGIARAFLGSFAETLLLQPRVPVLSVNPDGQLSDRISRVLFPTDFSQSSRRGFEEAVALCRELNARLWVYYKMPDLILSAYPEMTVLYADISETEEKLKTTGKAWAEWACNHGVETESVFDSRPGGVAQAILGFARAQKIELISMIAHAGPVESVLLGSTTREVVRRAQCPVWVQHSKE